MTLPPLTVTDAGTRGVVAVPTRGRGHRVIAVLTVLAVAVAIVGLVARTYPFTNHWWLGVAALAPYLLLGAPIAAVLSVFTARPILVAVAVVTTLVGFATQVPLVRSSGHEPEGAVAVTVMTANLRLGSADAGDLVRSVRAHEVDILTLQELTGAEADRLIAAGLAAVLPYHHDEVRNGAAGVGVWSRYPISAAESVGGFSFAFVTARVAVPRVALPAVVVAAHMAGPWPQSPADWQADMTRLPLVLDGLVSAAGGGGLVVGADLNATVDTPAMRRVLRNGIHDAAEQAGAGLTPTYPADSWLPPLMSIDHVLTHNAVATRVRTVSVPGSDHRALLVRVTLPPG